ncbi:MAG TPA: DUF523 domain-containing protein [Anaeromyxobacteraceae bacterium]|nr:DUF523 domain-containing protein [Anaeromyxobacteraceae bacterium]
MAAPDRPWIGISACLLGEAVRWDGRDKRSALLVDALGPRVEWIPVCPEVEVGMGVPREPIVLVGAPSAPRLQGASSGLDHTEAMRDWANRRVDALVALGIRGWVSKAGSPSCGPGGVPVWTVRGGAASAPGAGLFAGLLRARLPHLPIADEGELSDARFREAFLARCQGRGGG